MTKAQAARSYREQYGNDIPSLKLARIMYRENNLLFRDVDDARFMLRYIEGKGGKKSKKAATIARGGVPPEDRPKNPYSLPSSDEGDYRPYVIKGHRCILVLSDVHIPYHSISALTAAIDYAKQLPVDAILLNGDILDCYQLSRFEKDPNKRSFAEELEAFREFIEVLKREFPNARMYYKLGNHEERYDAFLMRKAHELVGVEEFGMKSVIARRAPGVIMIGDKRPLKIASLYGLHGHEYVGGVIAPVNPARGLFNRAKASSFQGHNHQTSEHTEPTLSGNMITTFSVGCLSELHPAYMPLNKWNHGFAYITVSDDGKQWNFMNKRILNGIVL